MRFRYIQFDPARHGRAERFRQLRDFFSRLLVNVAGDVDEALKWMKSIGERHEWFDGDYSFEDFKRDLLGEGTVERSGKTFEGRPTHRLTSRGEKWLREGALERIFTSLAAGGDGGDHRTVVSGGLGDETEDTRPYSYGDPVDQVAWVPTLRNALSRAAGEREDGVPLRLSLREEDMEIRERETNTGCATVLLIDISHSMVLYGEDRMFPAREIALALFQLITTRYRKDTLDLVLFGDEAVHVPLHRIPYIQAGPFHTNTKAGLRLAQSILSHRRHVNKQIFMVTDGKPSAIDRHGQIYKNPFGLDRMVVNRTLDEARACRKAGITVTTFMVARDPALVSFIDEFTKLNRGRAYFTGTDRLGETLFVDYLRNRRTRV